MLKKKIELIKPITYPDGAELAGQFQLGSDNRLYRSLIRLFEAFWIYSKKELYLVGGCVRDMLLGKTPKDYDLCTNATPDEVKEISKALGLKTFDSGIKHGTLTVIDDFHGQSYEVTTYRIDGKYSDGRHPDEVVFTPSLEEDLKRRDFTINSFAYDMLKQELLALDESYFKDLEYGMIRTVGNPAERFTEDALRMLRALRFAAQLNFTIQRDTYAAIKELAAKLSLVSKERIRDELTKILLSDKPDMIKLFVLSGLEEYAFGFTPLGDIMKCPHQNPWHYADVFHHTMDVVNAVPKTFELRWAALLHDTGKPATKALKEGTVDHYNYHGHPSVSAEIALKLMDILKFSNDQKDLVYKFIKYHDEPLAEVRNAKFKAVVNDIGKEHFADFIKVRAADSFAHNLMMDTKYAIDFPDKVKERFIKIISEDQALKVTDLAINGNDIIADGFLRGKEIGDCLRWMLDIVLEHPEYNTREKLLELLQTFKEMSFQAS
jgi:tRNA nucleotidyltransferase (CCA-adding enzyme)